MLIILIITIIAIILCCYKDIKINRLKNELDIKSTENKNLRRVLYENGLIPGNFIK